MRKTFDDWINRARGTKADLNQFETSKHDDMERVKSSDLPNFEDYKIHYTDFKQDNSELMRFLKKYERITIRAIPNEKGKTKGLTKDYRKGWPSTFQSCMQFLIPIANENRDCFEVIMTAWEPNDYGFVIISREDYLRAEIGKQLDCLSHGEEDPLASLIFDKERALIGHLEDKLMWLNGKGTEAAANLVKALYYITAPFDHFDPIFLEGYFEGVIVPSGIKFLDFKNNPMYCS